MQQFKIFANIGLLITTILFFSACASMKDVVYTPPEQTYHDKVLYQEVNVPFETAWQKLLDYTSANYFGIERAEKDAGLVVISFTADNPEDFITAGNLYVKFKKITSSEIFEGDYIKYYMNSYKYINSFLDCYYNIRLKNIDENRTGIQIKARYVLTSQSVDINDPLNILDEKSWVVNTGECNTVQLMYDNIDTMPVRTLCPTNIPENEIISAISK